MSVPHRGNIYMPPECISRIYDQYNVPYGAHPTMKLNALIQARTDNSPSYQAFKREVNFEITQLRIDINNYRQ